jgi:hypothetical protein
MKAVDQFTSNEVGTYFASTIFLGAAISAVSLHIVIGTIACRTHRTEKVQ